MPAFQAEAQMNPAISQLDTFFANMRIGISDFDVVQVSAVGHRRLHVSDRLCKTDVRNVFTDSELLVRKPKLHLCYRHPDIRPVRRLQAPHG